MASKKNEGAEGEAFISNRRKTKSKFQQFRDFLYNKEEGTVMGRTGKSWFQITLFYIIFYACLAGFFAVCLAVFVQTLDSERPNYFGKGSIIGINPGLGYQPWLRDDPESTLIYFDEENPKSYEKYVLQMEKFYKKYQDHNHTKVCGSNDADWPTGVKDEACLYDDFPAQCMDNSYGFAEGKPCVVLSLNRLIDWLPIKYPDNSVPDAVKDRYEADNVAVDCEGEYFADKDNIGKIDYYPQSGFPRKYFPYRKYKNYHSPLVFVKFESLPIGSLVMVECKAYAYNIIHDREDKLGMVHFELLRDRGVSGALGIRGLVSNVLLLAVALVYYLAA
jgi:sodium/potassium-transporting ATPase subunit beta